MACDTTHPPRTDLAATGFALAPKSPRYGYAGHQVEESAFTASSATFTCWASPRVRRETEGIRRPAPRPSLALAQSGRPGGRPTTPAPATPAPARRRGQRPQHGLEQVAEDDAVLAQAALERGQGGAADRGAEARAEPPGAYLAHALNAAEFQCRRRTGAGAATRSGRRPA